MHVQMNLKQLLIAAEEPLYRHKFIPDNMGLCPGAGVGPLRAWREASSSFSHLKIPPSSEVPVPCAPSSHLFLHSLIPPVPSSSSPFPFILHLPFYSPSPVLSI